MAGTVGKSNWLARTPTSRPLGTEYTPFGGFAISPFGGSASHAANRSSQPTCALNGFDEERFKVLVATDLASRGIHVRD